MSKLLSVGVADPPRDHAYHFTSLAVVGYALKHLPQTQTSHTSSSEPDIHEQAIGLQMATALQLLPHIQKGISVLMVTSGSNEVLHIHF